MYTYEFQSDRDNKFAFKYYDYVGDFKHFHQCLELVYVMSGEATAYIDDQPYHISAGQLCVVTPFTSHYYETIQKGNFIVILIPHRYIREYKNLFNAKKFKSPIITDTADKPILTLLNMFNNVTHDKDILGNRSSGTSPLYIEDMLRTLTSLMLRFFVEHCDVAKRSRISEIASNAVDVIDDNLTQDITIKFVCRKIGCTQKDLSYHFKKTLGISVTGYINRARVHEAAYLLTNFPDLSVSDIMTRAGFQSNRSFLRYFKEFLGCTPSEYRKMKNIE